MIQGEAFYDLISYVRHSDAGLIGSVDGGYLASKYISPAYAPDRFSLWSYLSVTFSCEIFIVATSSVSVVS